MDERWSQSATVDDVSTIRSFVAAACTRLGVRDEGGFRLVLAAGELCANAIIHGYGGGPGLLEVRVGRAGSRVSLLVRDEAPRFDPTAVRGAPVDGPLEDREPGGLGLHLVRQVVDEMEYSDDTGGNEILVTIDVGGRPPSGRQP